MYVVWFAWIRGGEKGVVYLDHSVRADRCKELAEQPVIEGLGEILRLSAVRGWVLLPSEVGDVRRWKAHVTGTGLEGDDPHRHKNFVEAAIPSI